MAAAPIRTAAPNTPVVGEDRSRVHTIRPDDWTAGDYESLENLIRHVGTYEIARVNRAREAAPESTAFWLSRYGGDPDVRARLIGA